MNDTMKYRVLKAHRLRSNWNFVYNKIIKYVQKIFANRKPYLIEKYGRDLIWSLKLGKRFATNIILKDILNHRQLLCK